MFFRPFTPFSIHLKILSYLTLTNIIIKRNKKITHISEVKSSVSIFLFDSPSLLCFIDCLFSINRVGVLQQVSTKAWLSNEKFKCSDWWLKNTYSFTDNVTHSDHCVHLVGCWDIHWSNFRRKIVRPIIKYNNVCTANFTPPEIQEVMYQLVTDQPEVQVIKGVECTANTHKRIWQRPCSVEQTSLLLLKCGILQ